MNRTSARVHVFVGKGGVGKTTCAAATGLHHSDLGFATLALSTDPTPSLSHIFGEHGPQRSLRVSPRLTISELGIPEVKQMWDAKFGREVYAVFSTFVDVEYPVFIAFMTSLLPGLREEFTIDYIRELATARTYDRIVWDTAPLGQTLALLQMPALLAEHLRLAPRVYSRFRGTANRKSVLEILEGWSELAEICTAFLREQTSFSLVTIPEALAVEQLDSVWTELGTHGFEVDRVIINNVVRAPDSPFLREKAANQAPYLRRLHERFARIDVVELPLFPHEIRGNQTLREVAAVLQHADQKVNA
ncbi:MAG TPA: ArsA family ATPase [Longimicrobiales bacterium]|nr:ArsA family ATPase [Longimicrobiales bacterium]